MFFVMFRRFHESVNTLEGNALFFWTNNGPGHLGPFPPPRLYRFVSFSEQIQMLSSVNYTRRSQCVFETHVLLDCDLFSVCTPSLRRMERKITRGVLQLGLIIRPRY